MKFFDWNRKDDEIMYTTKSVILKLNLIKSFWVQDYFSYIL